MSQLSKDELLQQLLGLNSAELLEIKSTLEVMEKHKISSDTIKNIDFNTRNTTKIKSKNAVIDKSVKDEQKKALEKSIINLKQDSIGQARFSDGLCCIKCGAVEGIVKNGKRKNGQQKYKCKNCGYYFSESKDSFISGTHKSVAVWETFIWCMNEGYTVRKAAEKCEIHRNTAWMWRHKVLNALRDKEEVVLGGIVEADDTFFLLSYKGNHKNKGDFYELYGREARKRGGENSVRGISHEQACVACGVDRGYHSYSKVAGTAALTSKKVKEVFTGIIQKESVLCVDGVTSYRQFAAKNHIQLENIESDKKKKGVYHLNNVNSFHSILKDFVRRYKGVSTKYLNNYLIWCTWLKRKKMNDDLRRDVMLNTALSYIGVIRYSDVVLGALDHVEIRGVA